MEGEVLERRQSWRVVRRNDKGPHSAGADLGRTRVGAFLHVTPHIGLRWGALASCIVEMKGHFHGGSFAQMR